MELQGCALTLDAPSKYSLRFPLSMVGELCRSDSGRNWFRCSLHR